VAQIRAEKVDRHRMDSYYAAQVEFSWAMANQLC